MTTANYAALSGIADDALRTHLQAVALAHEQRAWERRNQRMFTRRCAAAHESGHCVVHVVEGDPPPSVRIFQRTGHIGEGCRRKFVQGVWLGFTSGTAWELGPDAPAAECLRRARMLVSGWCGERLAGFREPGSSMDELLLAQHLVRCVATRWGSDHRMLWKRLLLQTMEVLHSYEITHRELTAALAREKRVKGKRLAALLRDVQPANQNGSY